MLYIVALLLWVGLELDNILPIYWLWSNSLWQPHCVHCLAKTNTIQMLREWWRFVLHEKGRSEKSVYAFKTIYCLIIITPLTPLARALESLRTLLGQTLSHLQRREQLWRWRFSRGLMKKLGRWSIPDECSEPDDGWWAKWMLPVWPLLAFSKFTHRRYLSIVPTHLYGFQYKFSSLWDCENDSEEP